jgi:hypothetical protein
MKTILFYTTAVMLAVGFIASCNGKDNSSEQERPTSLNVLLQNTSPDKVWVIPNALNETVEFNGEKYTKQQQGVLLADLRTFGYVVDISLPDGKMSEENKKLGCGLLRYRVCNFYQMHSISFEFYKEECACKNQKPSFSSSKLWHVVGDTALVFVDYDNRRDTLIVSDYTATSFTWHERNYPTQQDTYELISKSELVKFGVTWLNEWEQNVVQ